MSVETGSEEKEKPLSHKERLELFDKYNINHHTIPKPEIWPAQHQPVLRKVQELGDTISYEGWRADIYVDTSRPWRQETNKRAKRIADFARQCYGDEPKEEEWRRKVEHHIFHRFTLEISCRTCTGRLWRSENEAAAPPGDEYASRLSKRQSKRINCSCSSSSEDPSKIFSSQHSEIIDFEKELRKDLRKQFEQPDAVYGLRNSGRIKRLLRTGYKQTGNTIEETITTTPFRNRTSTFFPFLVSESKSEKAGVPQREIRSQMAFIIRKLLLIQRNLRKNAGQASRGMSEPLVWCLSHRGEYWRVCAAFMRRRQDVEQFHIVELWTGLITTDDGAIRLVLILDHIFDWARDVYREAIIADLKTLAVPSTPNYTLPIHGAPSSIDTTTVASVLGEDKNDLQAAEAGLDPEKWNQIASWDWSNTDHVTEFDGPPWFQEIQDPLGRFDSYHGVLRDAKFIRSHAIGLYITVENLKTLFKSTPNDKSSEALFKRILVRLEEEEPLFLNRETLIGLETAWTGFDRGGSLEPSSQDEFQVLLNFSAYLTPNWEQTRELCYIAISQPAAEALHRIVRKDRYFKGYLRPSYRRSTCVHDTEIILKIIRFHLQASIQTNLSACLYRCSLMPTLPKRGRGSHDLEDDIFGNNQGQFSCYMIPLSEKKSRTVVWSIYKSHRVGRNEPSSSFIHVSSRWDEQKLDHQQNKRLPTPWTTYPISNSENAILAYSKNPTTVSTISERCIFLVDRSKLEKQLAELRGRERVFTHLFWADRLGTESGWDVYAWNRTYDRRKVNVWKPVQEFLDHIEAVMQRKEKDQFGDDEGEDECNSSTDEDEEEEEEEEEEEGGDSSYGDKSKDGSSSDGDKSKDTSSSDEDKSEHSSSSDEDQSEDSRPSENGKDQGGSSYKRDKDKASNSSDETEDENDSISDEKSDKTDSSSDMKRRMLLKMMKRMKRY